MLITRQSIAQKLAAYLRHEIPLAALVDWAERAMLEAEFDESESTALRDVIARLGVADVRAFGLTWEECDAMLRNLGFTAHVEVVAA